MKYFTPELYLQFNSLDVDEAERADEAWDKAEIAYKERLTSIRENMPQQVVKLSELCLHDALVVSRSEHIQPAGECRIDLPFPVTFPGMWTAVAIMSVTIGWEVVLLIYSLSDCTTAKEAPQGWRLSKLQEQWLYDEVDLINDRTGPFVHRIMFSTGVTLEIHFTAVIIHKFTLPAAAKQAKQSA